MNIENNINKLGLFFLKINIKYFLLSIILIQIILHLPIFKLPPMGQHVWRQVMGLSMAKNYYEENLTFFESAQDIRIGLDDRGMIYTEFPLIYWLIGQSYHLTGFSHINGRVISFLFAVLLLIASYKLMKYLKYNEIFCRWFVFFMSFTPFFFYYSISFLPNLPSFALFLWGIVLIAKQIEAYKFNVLFFTGVVLLTLATITKQLYLFYGFPLVYLFLRKYIENYRWKILFMGFFSGIIMLSINYLLYLYGLDVNSSAPIERSSTVQLNVGRLPTDWKRYIHIIQTVLSTWFLEMYVNTAAIPIFIYGVYLSIKNKQWKSNYSGFWIMWILSFVIMFITFIDKFEHHGYYLTSVSILAALGSTYGMMNLLKKSFGRKMVIFLVLLMPLVMVGRVSHRWIDNKQVPNELIYSSHVFQKILPQNEKIIIHGDSTPLVYLYYLNRKGLSLDLNALSVNKMSEYKKKGIKWLVSDTDPSKFQVLKNFQYSKITKIGSFHIIKL